MDIVIQKRNNSKHFKRYAVVVIVVVFALVVGRYLWFLAEADFNVARDTLVMSQVQRGNFSVSVRGTGVLVPAHFQWLSAEVEASVVRVMVRTGDIVEVGDLLVELSNPQLVQELEEARWELEAQEAEALATTVVEELALLEQRAQVLNIQMNYESSLLRQKAEESLVSTGAVSRLDYDRTVLEANQLEQRAQIAQQQFDKMRENLLAQSNARKARLEKARRILQRIQDQVDGLHVRATMDSVVLSMPLEPGQRVAMGSNIARLATQDSLIAELRVPEIQIRDVSVGQRVVVDTRNNKIEGVISRVDPSVVDGNVQVDVVFEQGLSDDARPDLSVDGEIFIIDIEDALFVDRPLFAQSRSNTAVYRVTRNGQFAERTPVQLGYGSINRIQVLEGLERGDTIITSNPSRFQQYERFRIN
jgi:HlyD family secretion protein